MKRDKRGSRTEPPAFSSVIPVQAWPKIRLNGAHGSVIQLGRLIAIGTGVLLIALALEDGGALRIGDHQARIDLDGPVEVGECPVVPALLEPHGAAVGIDPGSVKLMRTA